MSCEERLWDTLWKFLTEFYKELIYLLQLTQIADRTANRSSSICCCWHLTADVCIRSFFFNLFSFQHVTITARVQTHMHGSLSLGPERVHNLRSQLGLSLGAQWRLHGKFKVSKVGCDTVLSKVGYTAGCQPWVLSDLSSTINSIVSLNKRSSLLAWEEIFS